MADKTDAPEDEDVDALGGEETDTPWDEQIDPFVTDIDDIVSSTYGISFRTLLINPGEYAGKSGISDTVKKVKDEVDSYFENLMQDLKAEQTELTKNMEEIDALYTKVDQAISSKAAIARIPYLRPVGVDFGATTPETISIDQYNNNIDSLLAKFMNISNYIANISTTYKKYNIGSWLFSGDRSYIVAINQPESMVITVENAQEYIDNAVDEAADALSSSGSSK